MQKCFLLFKGLSNKCTFVSSFHFYGSSKLLRPFSHLHVRTHVTCTLSPTQDWKNHKAFYKMVKNMPKSTTASKSNKKSSKKEETTLRPEDNVAKESLSDWDGNIKSAKCMKLEIGETYQKYGKGFAHQWWDEMTFNKKKKLLLLDVTSCSIPLTTHPLPMKFKISCRWGQSSQFTGPLQL